MPAEILRFKPGEITKLFAEGKMEVLSSPKRAKEILGKDFLGVEAIRTLEEKLKGVGVEVSFVTDELPPFLYTEEDLQAAKAMGEMLVLRPEEMVIDGVKRPITLIELRNLFQTDPLGKLPTVFHQTDDKYSDWYKKEPFATQPKKIKPGWTLVKKSILDESTSKDWNNQEQLIQKYVEDLKEKGAKHTVRRRTATEAVYDLLLYYVNTGEILLSNVYLNTAEAKGSCRVADWCQSFNYSWGLISVAFLAQGISIYANTPERSNPYVGVCPSRHTEEVTSIEEARQVLGKNFLDPEIIAETFGFKLNPDNVSPYVPFSQHDLENIRDSNLFLIARIDKTPDGKPLTMQQMEQLLQDDFKKGKKGRILSNTKFFSREWYIQAKDFFAKDTPRKGWTVTSRNMRAETIGKNYFEQTEIMFYSLLNPGLGFSDTTRDTTNKSIDYMLKIGEIKKLVDSQEIGKRLSELRINQMYRPTPVEILYDCLVYFQSTGSRLLEDKYVWTSSCEPDGQIILVGAFQPDGLHIIKSDSSSKITNAGANFSFRIF